MAPRILVVEDDPELCLLYIEELEGEGYSVETVKNGKEACERVQQEVPDLIIMDLNLPKMHGIDAMWNILSGNKSIPIIINTAYSEYRDNFMTWGAEAYVVKSGDIEPLKETIKDVLQRKASGGS